ncbi:MAG: nucleotide exchange factor GrpE, partial [Candidatus Magasanikbacteria bacterium RIFOXYC2_FULL_39_8]
MSDEQQSPNEDVKHDEKKKIFSKKCKNCGKKEQEALEYRAGWQRAHADYQNLVREMDTKKHEWLDWSKQQILEDFIPVYDNFKKAFAMDINNGDDGDAKWGNWKKGIGFIMKQFEDVLKGHGVEEIKTVGEQFNP